MARKDIFRLIRATFASAALFLLGGLIPVVGGFAMLFTPTPVMTNSVGLPNAMGRMAAMVAFTALLVGLTAGPIAAGLYAITFGLATVMMCYMLERRKPFELIVLCCVAAILVAGAIAAFLMAGSPAALADILRRDLTATMERGEKFYKMVGLDTTVSADLRTRVVEMTLQLSPALVAITAAFMVLANLAAFWRLTGRQERVGYVLFGDLVRWSTPEWLIWVLLVTGFGLFIPFSPLSTLALDCFVCVTAVYFCQGVAIMAFYFKVLAMPPLARGLIYFVTGVQPVLAALVCVAGILDLWIDFRRLKPPKQEARNFSDFI